MNTPMQPQDDDIEALLGSRVFLDLWVKVKKDWRNREGVLHNFGFGVES